MATRCVFENSNDVGVFANLTNAFCMVASGTSENFYRSNIGTFLVWSALCVVPSLRSWAITFQFLRRPLLERASWEGWQWETRTDCCCPTLRQIKVRSTPASVPHASFHANKYTGRFTFHEMGMQAGTWWNFLVIWTKVVQIRVNSLMSYIGESIMYNSKGIVVFSVLLLMNLRSSKEATSIFV